MWKGFEEKKEREGWGKESFSHIKNVLAVSSESDALVSLAGGSFFTRNPETHTQLQCNKHTHPAAV